jgi:hypothetical protein
MTNREFLTAIINLDTITDELKAEATARIEKIDATNTARKDKPSKKELERAEENAALLDQIYDEVIGAEAMPAADIAVAAGISVQKANAMMRKLVAAEKATVEEVKLPKKGAVKVYTKVFPDAE